MRIISRRNSNPHITFNDIEKFHQYVGLLFPGYYFPNSYQTWLGHAEVGKIPYNVTGISCYNITTHDKEPMFSTLTLPFFKCKKCFFKLG